MTIPLPRKTKRLIKGWLKTARLRYIQWRYAFDRDEFIDFLRCLGLKSGDVVLVHSSYGHFEAFTGKATDIIEALQEIVGEHGTLLMPTMPFDGTAIDYINQGKILDVKRTPSRMGMLTELFRRMPGVVRSVHPTNPAAAWGARANSMIADHARCTTPCGRQSPYGKLLDYNGRILFLGAEIESLTFFHTIEEILEPKMPFSPFTKEVYQLSTQATPGHRIDTRTRLFDPEISRRRKVRILARELKKRGLWKQAAIGNLQVVLLEAEDILQAAEAMAEKGIFCYDEQ